MANTAEKTLRVEMPATSVRALLAALEAARGRVPAEHVEACDEFESSVANTLAFGGDEVSLVPELDEDPSCSLCRGTGIGLQGDPDTSGCYRCNGTGRAGGSSR